ncbi:MAG: GMC family oxidoreductase N-terminal domain-containing protein [Desulfosudaceae bacterium]
MTVKKTSTEVVVVGSGPGGATVARELTRAGRKVIILERGGHNRPRGRMHTFIKSMGGYFGSPGRGLLLTPDLLMMVRAITVGGTTMFYTATAWDPPYEKWRSFGVDLSREETEKIKQELKISPLPDDWIGPAASGIMSSALELGYDWHKLHKFIDTSRERIDCMDTYCGDRHGTKWEAYQWIMTAVDEGARLMPRMYCDEIMTDHGTAVGVRAIDHRGRVHEISAEAVVVCAGGVGSPTLLQRSGLAEAGQKFFFDPFVVTSGYLDRPTRPGRELPMTTGMHLNEEGIMLTDITNPWFQSLLFRALAGRPRQIFKNKGQASIMIKVRDVMDGSVDIDGRISKPLTQQDRHKLNRGKILARRILRNLGATDIWNGALGAAHPGGTCRVGKVVDANLETGLNKLFVCDGSVIPFEFGLPPVLTIISLGRRLSGHLLNKVL